MSITGATATYDPDTSKIVSPYDYPDHSRPLQTSGVWSTKSDPNNDRPYGRHNAIKRPSNSKDRNLKISTGPNGSETKAKRRRDPAGISVAPSPPDALSPVLPYGCDQTSSFLAEAKCASRHLRPDLSAGPSGRRQLLVPTDSE